MAFMYDGVNVDTPVPGYPSSAGSRASNIITVANNALAYLDSIETKYMAAYTPYAAAVALSKTFDARSTNPAVRNSIIDIQTEISKLWREVANWTDIVKKNGGRITSDNKPDFTTRRNKYKTDITKNSAILSKLGPEVCSGLPPPANFNSQVQKDAKEESDKKSKELEEQMRGRFETAQAASNQLAAMTDRGADGNSPGIQAGRNPATANAVLNQVVASGGAGGIVSSIPALQLAWMSNPRITGNSNFPTSAQISSATSRLSNKQTYPKGPSLNDILSEMASVGGPKPRTSSAKPASGAGAAMPKPAPKPAPAPKPKPPKPAGRNK